MSTAANGGDNGRSSSDDFSDFGGFENGDGRDGSSGSHANSGAAPFENMVDQSESTVSQSEKSAGQERILDVQTDNLTRQSESAVPQASSPATKPASSAGYHTHAIPLDMDDIARDWNKPVDQAGIAAKASVIVRVGMLDLGAGTGSFRVREMMHRIASPLGVHVRADVNLTDIEAACTDGHERITEVVDLPTTGVNTERIWLLEHFADWFNDCLGCGSSYHASSRVSKALVDHLDAPEAKTSIMSAVQHDENVTLGHAKLSPAELLSRISEHAQITSEDEVFQGYAGNRDNTESAAGQPAESLTGQSSEKKRNGKQPTPAVAQSTYTSQTKPTPLTVGQVHSRLDIIEKRSPLYPAWFAGIASAMACASFVFLLGGGPIDMLGAFLGAGIGQWLRRKLFARRLNQFFVTFICVLVAGFVCMEALRLLGLFYPPALHHDTAYIGAMLFVIPGFPLIMGGLDMAKMDFPSGVQRLTYTLTIILIATLAGWCVAYVMVLQPDSFEPLGLNPFVNNALRFVAAFVGVWGFSVLFNSPQRMCLTAASIGAIADTVRLIMVDNGVPVEGAAFLGALLAGLLATAWRASVRHGWLPPHLDYPRTCLTVPSIVIMVPGMYMYQAMFHLAQFDTQDAIDWIFRAFMVIICLPIGLATARILTDKAWRYDV